ncbi:MAG: nicotinate phosphoribosyltransferase [Candidatus Lernaella stagnicola]|nr:nicotinate phosphoribosyltransferase [Candidatus Lernaella stagnicola]
MPYPTSPLFTDLYQLTMMQGYFREGMHERWACFDLFFRTLPFGGGFALTAGLADALAFLHDLAFSPPEIGYLRSLGLFDEPFLTYLGDFRFGGTVHAVPEGTPAFPYEPLLRVEGGLAECQLVETSLLNTINFQTLIATKAARVCRAAGDGAVFDFGMRRAQGRDGALSASRAAFIGGCSGSSNVEAGRHFGIPVRGTHAHSWIMAFPDELAAFRAYVRHYPDGAILLVDTYHTMESGIPNAITVAHEMETAGHKLIGVRLDSGDLANLAKQTRAMLDAAGLHYVKIVASSDLDEHRITALRKAGAPIDLWGVGTRLVTAHDDPALSGVYKLACLTDRRGVLRPVHKESDTPEKATLPGIKQVWRVADSEARLLGDYVEMAEHEPRLNAPLEVFDRRTLKPGDTWSTTSARPLLELVFRDGEALETAPPLADIRARAKEEIAGLPLEVQESHPTSAYQVALGKHLVALLHSTRKG